MRKEERTHNPEPPLSHIPLPTVRSFFASRTQEQFCCCARSVLARSQRTCQLDCDKRAADRERAERERVTLREKREREREREERERERR